jgi:glycosyltransferase involved in cell wall biosynthesis
MKLLFVFEFGLLHYRIPILEKISMHESVRKCDVMHAGNHTNGSYKFTELKANIRSFGRVKIITDVRKIKDDYDVIIFSLNLWRPDWIGTMFSSRKAKYIFWGHGFGRENNYLAARITKLFLAKWADAQIFYTEDGRKEYIRHGIPREKLFVAQNTLHIENSERSDATDKTDLIYVGRIQGRKGIDLLIRAFSLVKNEVPDNVKIKIIGNGDIAELQRLSEENHISDSVVFSPGVFNEEELKEVFINAIAYVSPNHVGLGVVHSFSYGVPVITNRKRKHAPEFEYCNDTNSLLYEGDVEQLAESIKQICTNKELQRSLSKAGYEYYQQNLRSDKMVKGFLDAFDYVLKSKKNKVTA